MDVFRRPLFFLYTGDDSPESKSEFERKKIKTERKGEKKVGSVDENIWDPMLDDEEDDW